LGLPDLKRYAYFIKRVVDWGEVWSLYREDGWVLAGSADGRELLPVWPHPEYARACVAEGFKNAEPRAIEIHDFVEKWIPGLIGDNRLVAVFPTPAMRGIARDPSDLKRDLEAELDLVE
jgi:hypothetical protein